MFVVANHRLVDELMVTKYFLKTVRVFGKLCNVLQKMQHNRLKIKHFITQISPMLQKSGDFFAKIAPTTQNALK